MLDLVLPLTCGGCGTAGSRWCQACAAALQVGPDQPHVVLPRVDPGVPVFALGRYAGPRRHAIVAFKEHGRGDLVAPLSRALALGIHQLARWGVLAVPTVVVPAPTRWVAARRRGGDPVARMAATATAGHPGLVVVPALRMHGPVRDSVGLTSMARQRNIAGRVRLTRRARAKLPEDGDAPDVLLVDDVLTTGATARESVRALAARGVGVAAVLTVAHV